MKKQLLIVMHAMDLGGVERSLLGLLDSLDPSLVDIDLFLLRHEGKLMDMIPSHVNLLPPIPAYTVLGRPMKDTLKEGHVLLTVARLYGKFRADRYSKKNHFTESAVALEYSHKFICPLVPDIVPGKMYDLAISFMTPHYFVANKVRAKKKLAWIHTDYKAIQIDIESELKMWNAYDYIASISDDVTESFLSVFPSLEDKILLIENILPTELIKRQSSEFDASPEMHPTGVKLLSIGRYCSAKNFDSIPAICSQLVASGLDVYWYIIGFGGDEALIRQKISEENMESRVILLGKKENPYPYIKVCDVYVQPSRYEGKSVAVREAQFFSKPVVITNYPTASSQLEEGVDGIIVPLDNEGCAKGITALLQNSQQMKHLSDTCSSRNYSNSAELKKIYQLIED